MWEYAVQAQKYYLETFGCQMNILDSQLVEGQLRARGLAPVEDYREADVILFNTCSVRQHAEDKVFSRLGQVKGLKRRKPHAIIGVIGCMAERIKEDLFVQAPHVDLICGPGELNQLPALLDEVEERHAQVAALAGSQSRRLELLKRAEEYDSLEALDMSRTPSEEGGVLQTYVRVQRGCDKFCTYCVVPFTRGPERSRSPEHIVEEARRLADHGCREVTLLGQTVNSYLHQENGRPVTFANLLERVHEIEGLDRIRFVTSYPADWDEDIFRVMRDYPRVMPFLHIPAQSGSNRILKGMRRMYTVESYLELMDTARRYIPEISLAGDFIVGFSGETEEDFQQTVDLVRRVDYESLFIFKYSERPGTKAERIAVDDVPQDVKARRNNELLAVQNEIGLRRKKAWIGREVEVLVEGPSKNARKQLGEKNAQLRTRGKHSPSFGKTESSKSRRDGRSNVPASEPMTSNTNENAVETIQLVGRTPGDIMALFDASPDLMGAIVKIRVDRASPHSLFGEVTEVISPSRIDGGIKLGS